MALPRLTLWTTALTLAATARGAPDFERDVAPILERSCLSCHHEAGAKGDLILETRALALEHPDALSPGNPGTSTLLASVSGPDPEMPKKGKALAAAEVETLRAWIADGAPWPEHRALVDRPARDLDWWSLRPIQEGHVDDPTLSGRHPVDALIGKKLAEKGLTPLPAADTTTLIRRITFDLTGLPPTPEEIDAFVTDPDWEALVDRLLASPAFGEKFARHWLDLARYGETHGYDKDKPRNNAWPYRDYVIRAFNEDKPYPRFVREQIAGDTLYPGEPDGVLGLGFLAAGPWDFIGHWEVGEGKLDGRIAKHLDRDEMVSAVFNVFQSTTVQCAQCHHHKFDPVLMEDYYRLHAVFAAVDRADRVYDGLPVADQRLQRELRTRLTGLKGEKERLEGEIKRLLEGKVSGIDQRLAELRTQYPAPERKPEYGYHSLITKKPEEEKWVQIDLGEPKPVAEIRIRPAHDDYAGIGAGFGFPVRYRIEASDDPEFKKGARTLLDSSAEDQPNPGGRPVRVAGGGVPFRYLRLTATRLAERKNDYILALGEIEMLDATGEVNFALRRPVAARDSIEQAVRWRKTNLVDGIYFSELSDDRALEELDALRERRDAIERATRPPETDARLAEIQSETRELEEKLKAFPEGLLVYAAATDFTGGSRFTPTGGKPRPIHLLHRGDLRTPGDPMTPGAPPLWPGARERFTETESWEEGDARAELARYLTRRDNPLLWRSITNRLWQWTLGAPLVATPNDFGRGGLEPTHPELLDFLAARLRDDPEHSLKAIVRLLVTSETYRRASDHHEANALIDGGNAHYWRAHRRRLSAEEFRDSVLAVGGALRLEERGGPSFQDFVIEKPQHSPHYEYHLHDPDDPKSHRRSIYRFVVRSQPQPMLTTLDCADPSMSVPERDESTTALQALTQWNHRFIEAMSRRFAERLRTEAPENPEERIHLACRLALGRPPTAEEWPVLRKHLETHGEESLARVVMNLNAFVYVD